MEPHVTFNVESVSPSPYTPPPAHACCLCLYHINKILKKKKEKEEEEEECVGVDREGHKVHKAGVCARRQAVPRALAGEQPRPSAAGWSSGSRHLHRETL